MEIYYISNDPKIDFEPGEIRAINKDTFNMKLKANSFGFKLWAVRNLDLVTVRREI